MSNLLLFGWALSVSLSAASPGHGNPPLIDFTARSDVPIAASVLMPTGGRSAACAIVAHGSGAPERRSAGWRHMVGPLSANGVRVVLWDERGRGDTPGISREAPDLNSAARDFLAVLEAAKSLPELRGCRFGAIGWSRGGWTATLAASQSASVEFVISLSGPGVSPLEQVIHQRGEELLDQGYSDTDVKEISALRRVLWSYYGTGTGHDSAREALIEAREKPWFTRLGLKANLARPAALAGPDFDFYRVIQFQPGPILERLQIPVLALFGAGDRHIPVDASVAAMTRAFSTSRNGDAQIVIFANAGHSLRIVNGRERMSAPDGHVPSHDSPPHPGLWPTVLSWLDSRFAAPGN